MPAHVIAIKLINMVITEENKDIKVRFPSAN